MEDFTQGCKNETWDWDSWSWKKLRKTVQFGWFCWFPIGEVGLCTTKLREKGVNSCDFGVSASWCE